MKKSIAVFLILTLNFIYCQDTTLFVGNSMVKYRKNHTLEILDEILKKQPTIHIIDDVCMNGVNLNHHLTNLPSYKTNYFGSAHLYTDKIEKAETPLYIMNHKFNKILFQEKPMTIVDSSLFYKKAIHDFRKLDSLAKNYVNQIYWLEPYSAIYTHTDKNPNINLDSLYEVAYNNYLFLKQYDSNLINVPIAYVTKEFHKKYPKLDLHIGGNHPNKRMQFILACCLYYSMFDGKPEDIPFLHLFKFDRRELKERGVREYTYKLYLEYIDKYEN
jgi:hypothetical protein